jgi:hypothetical protein
MRANRLRLGAGLCAALALTAVWTHAQDGTAQGTPQRPGWAVRASLSNPSATLYNTAKQKLLDGKQLFTYTISRLDVKLYCEVAQHYDYIWFEMQHSTMSYRDVEEMIAACPRPVATPVIRVSDEFESSIQKATDIGALGAVPTSPIGGSSTTGRRSTGISRRGPAPADDAALSLWRCLPVTGVVEVSSLRKGE